MWDHSKKNWKIVNAIKILTFSFNVHISIHTVYLSEKKMKTCENYNNPPIKHSKHEIIININVYQQCTCIIENLQVQVVEISHINYFRLMLRKNNNVIMSLL